MITVDIDPQWDNLVDWYWENYDNLSTSDKGNAISIWTLLEREYGVIRVNPSFPYNLTSMKATFPDDETYMMFVLKWS